MNNRRCVDADAGTNETESNGRAKKKLLALSFTMITDDDYDGVDGVDDAAPRKPKRSVPAFQRSLPPSNYLSSVAEIIQFTCWHINKFMDFPSQICKMFRSINEET